MEATLEITRSVDIAAARERVWKALTDPTTVGKWFEQMSFASLKPGEKITFSWGESGEIALSEPMERFGWRWLMEPGSPRGTLVMFTLETIPNGTRVTVRETGFENLPESARRKQFSDNVGGWAEKTASLKSYLETETMPLEIRRSVMIAAPQERVWKALTQPAQLSQWYIRVEFARLEVGQPVRFSWEPHPSLSVAEARGELAVGEPMDRFGLRGEIDPPNPVTTLVVFELEPVGDETRVTVIETGFEALPDGARQKRYADNIGGWAIKLPELKAYMEAG
jgi:uncharacterized protein YndB with AHSA1/START domain